MFKSGFRMIMELLQLLIIDRFFNRKNLMLPQHVQFLLDFFRPVLVNEKFSCSLSEL